MSPQQLLWFGRRAGRRGYSSEGFVTSRDPRGHAQRVPSAILFFCLKASPCKSLTLCVLFQSGVTLSTFTALKQPGIAWPLKKEACYRLAAEEGRLSVAAKDRLQWPESFPQYAAAEALAEREAAHHGVRHEVSCGSLLA